MCQSNPDRNPDRKLAKAATLTASTVTIVGGVVMVNGVPVEAASFEVTTLTDVVDGGDGLLSLREAILEANGASGLDVITFAPGLTGTSTLIFDSGRALQVRDDLSIVGPGQSSLTLTGPRGVLYVYADVSLTGFTIDSAGGNAINAYGASLTMSQVTISDAGRRGISFSGYSSNPNLTIRDSIVSGSGYAGVLANRVGSVVIERSSFTGNTQDGVSIGTSSSNVTLTDVISENNAVGLRTAFIAGDVSIASSSISANFVGVTHASSPGNLSITESSMTNNARDGVRASNVGAVSMTDSIIVGASYGLYVTNASGVTVSDSDFARNAYAVKLRSVGGATDLDRVTVSESRLPVSVSGTLAQDVSITNSTITTGTSVGRPVVESFVYTPAGDDAPAFAPGDPSVTIAHTTITGNATSGVVRSNLQDVVIDHSIVTGNGGAPLVVPGSTGVVTATNSLVPVGSATGASNIEVADALVGALANDGGTTRTMLPQSGSPAIDGGDVATAVVVPLPTTDQRGSARVSGDAIDIGAVETVTPDVISISPATVSVSETSGSVALTVTRTGNGVGAASVAVATVPGTATTADFTAISATVSFADGELGPKTVTLTVAADGVVESSETLSVVLSVPVGAVLGSVASSAVTITDSTMPPVDVAPLIVPIDPARLVDTRPSGVTIDDTFDKGGRPESGTTVKVKVAGRGGVPADAIAAVLTVTAVNPGSSGYATVHPCLAATPNASSLNFTQGVTVSNEIIAELSDSGEVCVFIQGDIDLVIDVSGIAPAGSAYKPVDSARLVDTRPTGATIDDVLEGGGPKREITVKVGGRAGVPVGAAAAVVNVAAVSPTTNGFVTVHPCLSAVPLASSLNFTSGTTRANEIIAPLNDAGELCIAVSGDANILVDVAGYVPDDPTYATAGPARFVDTRADGDTIDNRLEHGGVRGADSQLVVPVAGRGDVPANAIGVVANVTVAGASGVGFVTAHSCIDPRPLSSSLNFVGGVNGASEVVIGLDDDGDMCLYTSTSTNIIVDVVGYMLPAEG